MEGLTSLATAFYGNYVFFLLHDHYALGNVGNLGVAALQGLLASVAAWKGGQFAQRQGYFKSLLVGFGGMAVCLFIGCVVQNLIAQLLVLGGFTIFACFVWPALQALASEGEFSKADLSRTIGIYNVVWSATAAVAYFFGGALFDQLGPRSIFWLPATVFALEIFMAIRLARNFKVTHQPLRASAVEPDRTSHPANLAYPRLFMKLAWLANPFAGIGINTVVALIPGLARELHLSATQSGVLCSVWFFARLVAFVVLWHWHGWHFRFRWLLGAFLALMGSFAVILTVRDFWYLGMAQVVFGLAVGFMYSSSLFYSMNVGETKGEHGGLHEAAMGAGNCVGPAVGAIALILAPQATHAAGYAVTGLMTCGLVGLIGLRFSFTGRRPQEQT